MPKKKNVIALGSKYSTLLVRVKDRLMGLERLIKQETVGTYWSVGQYISEHILENAAKPEYGKTVIERLAEDLNCSGSLLWRVVKFYQTYPKLAARPELEWTKYKLLLTVKDDQQRLQIENRALKNNWNSNELAQQITTLKTRERIHQISQNPPTLAFTRGQLNTYQVISVPEIPSKNAPLFVDCGFKILKPLPPLKGIRLKDQDYLHVNGTKINRVTSDDDQRFCYKAHLQRVVDGDTLIAIIDCGFNTFISQRLRLRHINTPEMSSAKGAKAKNFVEAQLKNASPLIIKTHKTYTTDKYDRYLVDVFYLKNETDAKIVAQKGKYLNQELLNAGLAHVV